jgi:Nuclease-related domain
MWDNELRTVTCLQCSGHDDGADSAVTGASEPPAAPPTRLGTPGGSALQEYERRHKRYEERVDQKFGFLAPLIKLIADEPQSTQAWAQGGSGEDRIGTAMAKNLGDDVCLLFDCSVPRSRANIDMIAVAASGVWVIDAKKYRGKVQVRDVGGWLTPDKRLYVGGRDKSKKAAALNWQVDAVRNALPISDTPVMPVMCLVDAEWPLFSKPILFDGVWVTWGAKLRELIRKGEVVMTQDLVSATFAALANALPPRP